MFEIKLTNSLTKKKEIFIPQTKMVVKIYVCGITPYDYSHLGHGRAYVNFDVLIRLLKFLGYTVNYVRNFTDIDDKILNKANQQGDINLYGEIANKFIQAFHEDTAALGCLEPNSEPRVTQFIHQIIKFVENLIQKGNAYVVDSDVYFDISSFKDYGKLSGRTLEEQQAGARVEVDIRKRNSGDFVLWKGNTDGMFWQSPWGFGRPGWHIECSAMAYELLGTTIDIHGGGADLIFPHHENEIAQSEGLHDSTFARYWIHNAFVTVNQEKMSKSMHNFVTLKDIFQNHDPMILRYFFIQHHYRTPIDFSDTELHACKTAYKKLVSAFNKDLPNNTNAKNIIKDDYQNSIVQEIVFALCDDLNTPRAIGIVFENLTRISQNAELKKTVHKLLTTVLGLSLAPINEIQTKLTPEIEELIKQREVARASKNWALADKLREDLSTLGYHVRDSKINK